eukprot:ANDGO_05612.mRNA.1 hypothetical protein GUITHDRAFT_160757
MAFTSRSSRNTSLIAASSSPSVGPGAYDFPSAFSKTGDSSRNPQHTHSLAPFSSTSKRDFGPNAAVTSLHTPGPGSHDLPSAFSSHGAGYGSVFKSHSNGHTTEVSKSTPSALGPGSYVLPDSWAPKQSMKDRIPDSHATLQWIKVPSAPSVPARHQCFGYEEGPSGELIMQKPTETKLEEPVPDPQSKWSKSGFSFAPPKITTSKLGQSLEGVVDPKALVVGNVHDNRVIFTGGDGKSKSPGPGSYDPPSRITAGNLDSLRPSAAFVRPQSAQHSSSRKIKAAETAPGPGSYEIPGAFRVQHRAEHLQCFGSTSVRDSTLVDSERISMPGPGAYLSAGATLDSNSGKKDRSFSRPGIGFATGTLRFASVPQSDAASAPLSYYNPETMSMAALAKKRTHGRFGAFGATSSRFDHNEEVSRSSGPSPGSYNPIVDTHPDRIRVQQRKSAVFVSRSDRNTYGGDLKRAEHFPGPGSYDSEPVRRASPPSKSAFTSTSPRFGPASLRGSREASEMPGPGQYSLRKDFSSANANTKTAEGRGQFGSAASRFSDPLKTEEVVGPGSHNVDVPWVRKSFNITIERPGYLR